MSGGFSAEATWRTLVDHQVTDFAAAPTVYRGLRSSSVPVPRGLSLERASSAGEPLTPEVNERAGAALGLAVHDHFGQTEVGMPTDTGRRTVQPPSAPALSTPTTHSLQATETAGQRRSSSPRRYPAPIQGTLAGAHPLRCPWSAIGTWRCLLR
ncbi:AMP-binding protein [Streptomyces canus]|uniref:AMP-binding protein n=1 Tax=Streptomyces canus TaxID=58343 RepID=UPI0036E29179